jgi:hypothetical protein
MSLKYEIKELQIQFYKFIKAYKLHITQKSKSLNCTITAYFMLSKVNERRLSVYKHLY